MIITHFVKTGEYKDKDGGWDGDFGEHVEIEIEYDDLKELIIDYISEEYDLPRENVSKFINDLDWYTIDAMAEKFNTELGKLYEQQHYGEDIE